MGLNCRRGFALFSSLADEGCAFVFGGEIYNLHVPPARSETHLKCDAILAGGKQVTGYDEIGIVSKFSFCLNYVIFGQLEFDDVNRKFLQGERVDGDFE